MSKKKTTAQTVLDIARQQSKIINNLEIHNTIARSASEAIRNNIVDIEALVAATGVYENAHELIEDLQKRIGQTETVQNVLTSVANISKQLSEPPFSTHTYLHIPRVEEKIIQGGLPQKLFDLAIPQETERSSSEFRPEEKEELLGILRNMQARLTSLEENFINKKDIPQTTIRTKTRGPNLGSLGKIKKLSEFRDKEIRERGEIPAWLTACKTMKIDPRLVTTHAPELRENWDIKSFKWKPRT